MGRRHISGALCCGSGPAGSSRTPCRPIRRLLSGRCRALLPLALAVLAASAASGIEDTDGPVQHTASLTYAARLAAQRAIEEVYWSHRTWPKTNPGPKPPLDAVLSDAKIREKVDDYLGQSDALATLWEHPLTGDQLQAEMQRMAAGSCDPALLRELFAALDDDPLVIAETLVRQRLAGRLIRTWYAHDDRFHGERRREAESALVGVSSGTQLPSLGGEYIETTFRLQATGEKLSPQTEQDSTGSPDDPRQITVDGAAWRARIDRLADMFGVARNPAGAPAAPSDLPLMLVSSLQEEDHAFMVATVLESGDELLTTAGVWWPKTPFDDWWSGQDASSSEPPAIPRDAYELPVIRASGSCTPDTWSWEGPPASRALHTAVWTGSEMIIWGGGRSFSGGRYDPATDTWLPTSLKGAPAGRDEHSAVWTGTEMIVWGGAQSAYTDLSSGGRYDPADDSWTAMSTVAAPSARSRHTAVWTGTEMIVWGGKDAGQSGGRYHPATDSWAATPVVDAPQARTGHSAVWTGSEMIVWGGYDEGWLDTGGRYDPALDLWTPTSRQGVPAPRNHHAAVWTGSEMIVWGGWHEDAELDSGGRYAPTSDTWVPTTTTRAPRARTLPTAIWTGGEMIIWGGESPVAGLLSTGGRYDPLQDAWQPTQSLQAPPARRNHTAVWTGREMIIWGGYTRLGDAGRGGRYDPISDTWVPTYTGLPETGRFDHAAVWTGSEMLVWGGRDDNDLNTGDRFDPATSTWVPMSTVGAPSARSQHTAVWTGREMIVWGGSHFGSLNTGGRYDPTTDSWSSTSLGGVPSARSSYTAVWTGHEMIVWGGWDDGTTRSGGRYDPEHDAWRSMTVTDAPDARYYHSAVWTGDEMIVWGGYDDDGQMSTGGRYAPESDLWVATAVAGAPDARGDHSAVWTGDDMIVWGGYDGNGQTRTGGRYKPAADSWVGLSIADAPTPRSKHSVVWTGREMIVWGGYDGRDRLSTGGRYDPATDAWTATPAYGVPSPRKGHTAVWTGREMIIWGGESHRALRSGGRFCAPGCPAPTAVCRDVTVPAGAGCMAEASIDAGSSDPGYGELTSRQVPPGPYPLGESPVTLVVENACGAADACGAAVRVVDETPPVLGVTLQPDLLWPPNHRLVDVAATVSATDACGPASVELTSVSSSEPDDGSGDGRTTHDVQGAALGTADFDLDLRAERDAGGSGRIYHVVYTATDMAGNRSSSSRHVAVPLDLSGVTEPILLSVHLGDRGTLVSWTDVPGALRYNVVRGLLTSLRDTGSRLDLGPTTCIETGSPDTASWDETGDLLPPPGDAFFYVVEFFDGSSSGFGTESALLPRTLSASCQPR